MKKTNLTKRQELHLDLALANAKIVAKLREHHKTVLGSIVEFDNEQDADIWNESLQELNRALASADAIAREIEHLNGQRAAESILKHGERTL